jgi:hypothetical protein
MQSVEHNTMTRVGCESLVKLQVRNFFRMQYEMSGAGAKLKDVISDLDEKVSAADLDRHMSKKVSKSELAELSKPLVVKLVRENFKMIGHNEALMAPIRGIVNELVFCLCLPVPSLLYLLVISIG